MHMAAAIGNYGMLTSSQRKLNICKLDGSELYKGLKIGFFDCERASMRAVSLAEESCGFL